ncbi:MAG: peroxiredoxin [Devosia nanyangense]|uniref:Glutathione-dependent peroxiredoxin n=1 Tax=Devosia nanyangense TaxID=1228055 RepID=A0A933L5P7_9HYPH|nr:peroxiredoxin [Devosia nanyangense]
MIKAGDKLPSVPVRLVDASGVTETDTLAILGKGRVVLFAVPGAFTPTCDTSHLPGFVAAAGKIKAAGISRIVCAAVNDHHVVKAWAERSEAVGAVDFIADAKAEFAEALGLAKDFSDLGRRFRRFAMIIKDGVVEKLFVQDVSGVTVSGAPAILLALQGEAVS